MGRITIKNLSVLEDYAAVARVAYWASGDEYAATHSAGGFRIVEITQRGRTYTVTDAEEAPCQ